MTPKKNITRDEWSSLIVVLAVLLGAYLRFNPTLLAGFAINDGGMFAVMVDDLKFNRFVIPAYTRYNHLNIPFAYPPLGFYFGAIASTAMAMETPQVLRWVPAFFASLSVPAFYFLAVRLLKNKYYASVSTLFYAVLPRALSWFVMGGGLTRSPGQLFMLITLGFVIRLYEENRRSDIFWAGLFGGLAVLSHPEAAVHTAVSAVFLWVMISRKQVALVNSMFVGLIVLLVTAPWWVTVISHHGTGPLLNAAATGQNALAVFHLVFFVFTEEPYATVIAVLGLIGIMHRLIRREYLLPLWMIIPFLVEGRSAAGPASIPLAMLAAIGLVDVIFAALVKAQGSVTPATMSGTQPAVSSIERNIFIYLLLYLTFSTSQFGSQLSAATLFPPDREAMAWVRKNTPPESKFLVLTGTTSVSCDSVLEWFPALTGRQSIFTVQGTEWTKGEEFNSYVKSTYSVQECLAKGDLACLDSTVGRSDYDYVYVSKTLRVDNCQPLYASQTFPYFVESLKSAPEFEVVYETEDVLISKQD